MIPFLITAFFVLVFLFLTAVLVSAALWIVTKLLRLTFPDRFRDQAREKDEA